VASRPDAGVEEAAGIALSGTGGILSGAGIGAAAGSFLPGIGTVAGGIVGGTLGGAAGLLGSEEVTDAVDVATPTAEQTRTAADTLSDVTAPQRAALSALPGVDLDGEIATPREPGLPVSEQRSILDNAVLAFGAQQERRAARGLPGGTTRERKFGLPVGRDEGGSSTEVNADITVTVDSGTDGGSVPQEVRRELDRFKRRLQEIEARKSRERVTSGRRRGGRFNSG
jgi:hypothetical protein